MPKNMTHFKTRSSLLYADSISRTVVDHATQTSLNVLEQQGDIVIRNQTIGIDFLKMAIDLVEFTNIFLKPQFGINSTKLEMYDAIRTSKSQSKDLEMACRLSLKHLSTNEEAFNNTRKSN